MQTARRSKILFVTLLAAAILVTGCGAEEETQDDRADEQSTQEQTAERTEERNKDRTKEDTKVGKKGDEGKGSGGEIALEIGGDPGTAFSGVCSIGDEENEISGEVPKSFSYELEGQQLECEIRKEEDTDSGALEVLLTGPGDRIEQRIDSPGGTINLVYSENGVSSSTSSSGSSSSVNQVISSSSSSGSE